MKKYIYSILALAALSLAACSTDEMPAPEKKPLPQPSESVDGELIVKFAPYVSEILDKQASLATRSGGPATRSGILTVDEVLNIIGTHEFERVFPVDNRTEERARKAELHLWYVVRFDADQSASEVAERLSALGEIQNVSYNKVITRSYNPNKRARPLTSETLSAIRKVSRAGSGYAFNDPLLEDQWHLINRGNLFAEKSISGADVQCEQAWAKSTGDPSIIVAILDEGVTLTHPDLRANIWVNEGEIFADEKDNDGNGYKGDRHGFNFVKNTGNITSNDYLDTGHGTHVAGVIAAVNNNAEGISSIAGGNNQIPGVKIMSCQIFAGNQQVSMLGQVRAIKYAADNGAVVLQCSWGYASGIANGFDNIPGFTTQKEWEEFRPLEKIALDYFVHNAGSPNGVIEGGIAVFAAGNETAAQAGYPGASDEYVAVAATAADFTPAVYTNYGLGTTISAPGGDMNYYYEYGQGAQTGEVATILSTLPFHVSETGYGYMEGTSMACPHVSGVVALGLSYAHKLRRHFTAEEFKTLLYQSSTPIDQYMKGTKGYYKWVNDLGHNTFMQLDKGLYNGKMGSGQVNATKLLDAIDGSGTQLSFPNIYIRETGIATTIPGNYFVNGETLTYTVSIADQSISTSRTEGSKLIFEGLKQGMTKATITSSAGETHSFVITVRKGANGNGWL